MHRDPATGKFNLLGTFSTLGAQRFPANVRFCIYFAVTDGLGKTQISLRIVDAEPNVVAEPRDPVFTSPSTDFDFGEDPLMVWESMVLFTGQLPKAGLYHCDLYANDELLMSRRLLVVEPVLE